MKNMEKYKEIENVLWKHFLPISLKQMDTVKLMNRTDTKFLLNKRILPDLLLEASLYYKVLEIENKRMMSYSSNYFDTEEYTMYHAHHNGKLNRFKIRWREYVDSNLAFLEVKFKNNKGRTIKSRINHTINGGGFPVEEKYFIEKNTPFAAKDLVTTLKNSFFRITLVGNETKERITIDFNLLYENNKQQYNISDLVIVEVKQEKYSLNSNFVKLLRERGVKPTGMSKYCIGTALLHNDVKTNLFKPKIIQLNKISEEANIQI